jgi:CheY-like chemotaxis protein
MIKEGRGTHFDPDIVDAFLELKDTFRNIALTYADFDDERKMLTATEGLESEAYKSIENILLVEDNEISLEIMLSQLTSLGYNVDTAANGQPALFKYKQTTYDLILTDLEMPEMDGYALAAKIRRLEKGSGRSTLILAVTASDYDLTDEGIKSLGFDGYMLKPLDVKVFQLKLASIVYNKSQIMTPKISH